MGPLKIFDLECPKMQTTCRRATKTHFRLMSGCGLNLVTQKGSFTGDLWRALSAEEPSHSLVRCFEVTEDSGELWCRDHRSMQAPERGPLAPESEAPPLFGSRGPPVPAALLKWGSPWTASSAVVWSLSAAGLALEWDRCLKSESWGDVGKHQNRQQPHRGLLQSSSRLPFCWSLVGFWRLPLSFHWPVCSRHLPSLPLQSQDAERVQLLLRKHDIL